MADHNGNDKHVQINELLKQQRELNEMQKVFMQQQKEVITTQCESLSTFFRTKSELRAANLKNINLILTIIVAVLTSLSWGGNKTVSSNLVKSAAVYGSLKSKTNEAFTKLNESKQIFDGIDEASKNIEEINRDLKKEYAAVTPIVENFSAEVKKAVNDDKFTSGALTEYSTLEQAPAVKDTMIRISLEQKACNLNAGCKEYQRQLDAKSKEQVVYWVNIVNTGESEITGMQFISDLPPGFNYIKGSARLWYRDNNRVDKLMTIEDDKQPLSLRELQPKDDYTITFVATIDENIEPKIYNATHKLLNKNGATIDTVTTAVTVVDSGAMSQ